ncbi:MAG: prolyl oligopeptidase family serine peptidase [Bacteroidota bacterium]
MDRITYPAAPAVDQVDDYHGTLVRDPYRWLEDVDSAETREWVRRQNELTFNYLERIPARDQVRERLSALWDYPRALAPFKRGGRYFQLRNSGLQNQDILYVSEDYRQPGRLLLDPNLLSEDGTAALNNWTVSEDGRWLAYAVSRSGSDWQEWSIRDVETCADLPEILKWSKFENAAWAQDGSGFFYSRYPEPASGEEYQDLNYNQKLYFHLLRSPQAQDRLIYARPDQPEWAFSPVVSHDGRYLVIHVTQGTDIRNRFFYMDLEAGGKVIELVSTLEALFEFVGSSGTVFYLRTDLDAPRARLIAIDITHPERSAWRTILPEGEDTLEAVRLINGQFAAVYLHDAYEQVRLFSLEGTPLGEIPLPCPGSVSYKYIPSLTGQPDEAEMFYIFQSFAYPVSVFRYEFTGREPERIFSPRIDFDFDSCETGQVFAPSRDGTKIPMFLVHKKGIKLDGRNPTLLYGYGGFNIPITPAFDVSLLAWLEIGGVYASANLRGGSEYGEEWHKAGMLHNKQNVFDDFIACAEFLIEDKITSTDRLAIHGGSNGGLLVGACMTQRPDLFGACVPSVGVMDMLRFHRFTIGWAWVSDYGSADDPEGFKTLYAYSPYHNLEPGVQYPATLVTTADHDDRVVPGHSFKFAAALQAAQAGPAPVLIRIQTLAGHGAGKPTSILIQEDADIFAFLVSALGVEPIAPTAAGVE